MSVNLTLLGLIFVVVLIFFLKSKALIDFSTPGPRIMGIHLVRNSTSARFDYNSKIFT